MESSSGQDSRIEGMESWEIEPFNRDDLIDGLWTKSSKGVDVDLEPKVMEWLQDQAVDHNRFIMPLADLELEGNAKPVKVEKPRKSFLKRILTEMGR